MRVAIATCVVVASGCGFSPSVSGDAAPPPDQVIAVDQDGDDVDDSVDNCPTLPNPSQADHDHDGIGDVCDRCPFVADPADPDMDSDGVGDPCDPRPLMIGDRRLWFYDFDVPSDIASWVPASSTGNAMWTNTNGLVSQANINAVDALYVDPDPIEKTYVVASITLDATTSQSSVGFCASVASNQQYCCTVRADLGVVASSFAPANGVNTAFGNPWTGSYTPGTQITLIQSLEQNNHCEAHSGATTVAATTIRGATGGKLELYTSQIKASFDFLFVVNIGN